jgi:hypothetical protein
MAGVRFTDLQSRPLEFLDFTSLTLNEFQQLVPPFETAFHTRMAAWRMDGKPRTARRFTVYKNCPMHIKLSASRKLLWHYRVTTPTIMLASKELPYDDHTTGGPCYA